jgi:hypothetical protein
LQPRLKKRGQKGTEHLSDSFHYPLI